MGTSGTQFPETLYQPLPQTLGCNLPQCQQGLSTAWEPGPSSVTCSTPPALSRLTPAHLHFHNEHCRPKRQTLTLDMKNLMQAP